jgi:hypothetical protein
MTPAMAPGVTDRLWSVTQLTMSRAMNRTLRHAAVFALVALFFNGCAAPPVEPPKWLIMVPPLEGDTAPLSKWHTRLDVTAQSKEVCEDSIASIRKFDRREGLPPASIYGPTGEYVCVAGR